MRLPMVVSKGVEEMGPSVSQFRVVLKWPYSRATIRSFSTNFGTTGVGDGSGFIKVDILSAPAVDGRLADFINPAELRDCALSALVYDAPASSTLNLFPPLNSRPLCPPAVVGL